jgi:type VI secretion system protein ImpL
VLWLAIALVLLVVLTWAATLLFKLPLWIAIVVTVLAIVAFITVLVIRRVRAALRANRLEHELLQMAAAQAAQVRPDRRPEIIALREQMKAAIAGLKRTKLGGKGGNAALYALPWYAIVGPPAAGKTTALERSGLSFTAPLGSTGSKIRGTAGTRNCDWWFSRDAILLDTAGRFATAEDDQEEWFTFLDTVRKCRPERPLDGLVVAVSVESLLGAGDDELNDLAKKIRSRVDEVMTRLEMVLPLYVLFTKADLVPGFIEFCGDLSKAQRAQAWGATFGVEDARLAEPARAVEAEFDVLTDVIHARMLDRLSREAVQDVRARVLQFPMAFERLRVPVSRFIEELCQPDPYRDSPILRGFYFSSGTQTGVSMDRVLANMSKGFDLRPTPAPEANRNREAHSYFVTELFEKVIFPDRHLGMHSTTRVRRRVIQQILMGGSALLITLVAVLPAIVSFARNRDLIADTADDVSQARNLASGTTADAADLLLTRVGGLELAEKELRIPGFWGPRVAPELRLATQRVYLERLRAIVSGPIRDDLTTNVRDIGNLGRVDAQNFKSAYDDLKLYLMLTHSQHLNTEWAAAKLAQAWLRAMAGQGKSSQQTVEAHARRYVEALAADSSWAWAPDDSIITRAQGSLAAQHLDDLRYAWLVDATKDVPPVTLNMIFSGDAAQYFSARDTLQVRGLYTSAGWEKVRELLSSPDAEFDIDPWVLGQDVARANDGATGANRLQDLYFQKYVREWSDFIAGISVVASPDIKGADNELRVLTEANGPYVRLFQALSRNTTLDMGAPSAIGKVLEKAVAQAVPGLDAGVAPRTVSSVERHFEHLNQFAQGDPTAGNDARSSYLGQYLKQLAILEVALSQLAESKAEPGDDFSAKLAETTATVKGLLNGLDTQTRSLVEPLLLTPIRSSRAGVFKADHSALSEHWKAEVWETWNNTLATRFPFSDTGADASLAEFSDFFRPQLGLIWKFFDEDLKERLERSGDQFVPKSTAEPEPFLPEFLSCLNAAQQITDAIFGTLPEAKLPFEINTHSAGPDISEITLRIDGVPTTYKNEPEHWQAAQWPGPGPTKGAGLEVKANGFTDEIPRDGDFGLFRLLAVGGLKPVGTGREPIPIFVSTWSLNRAGTPPVTIELKPSKSIQPFARDFFKRMKCPAQVMSGAASDDAAP